jgi:hypothetical protein
MRRKRGRKGGREEGRKEEEQALKDEEPKANLEKQRNSSQGDGEVKGNFKCYQLVVVLSTFCLVRLLCK